MMGKKKIVEQEVKDLEAVLDAGNRSDNYRKMVAYRQVMD